MAVSMLGACSDLLLQQQQQQTVRIVGREQQSCYSSIICCYCNPKSSTHFSRSSQSLALVSRSRIAAASKVSERGGFQAAKQKEENPSVLISGINLARILPDVPRNQKSRGGFWLPLQPQSQQREEEE